MKFEIRTTPTTPAKSILESVVETNFGAARNFICEGTLEYCEKIKQKMMILYKENKK